MLDKWISHDTVAHLSVVGLPLLFVVGATLATVACARVAVGAWRDVLQLDRGEVGLQEMMLRPMLERIRPTKEIEIRALRNKLVQAGLRDDAAITRFTMLRLWSLGGALALVPALGLLSFSVLNIFAWTSVGLGLAMRFPDYYIGRLTEARQAKIARALPSAMDLMVLCLDVGLSVESAWERVTLEMRSFEPLMADEAQQMSGEIAAGVAFPQALKRLAERVGLEELLTLSRLISQASQLGASVATALREYSEAANQKRILGLEERAGKISSLMVLPITLCMLPATLIALVGPAVIMLVKAFAQM